MKRQKRFVTMIALLLVLALPSTALGATITGNKVNLRSGASLSSSRLTYLYRGDSVSVLGKSGDWYQVRYNALTGYVHGDYVDNSTSTSGTTLMRGQAGSAVKELQGNLIYLGYLNDIADGIFGAKTQAAVRLYQTRNGLSATGVADANTRNRIASEVLKLNAILDRAKSYLGVPYVYGGNTPQEGFDCSGFTKYVLEHAAGINIPRVSYQQAAAGIAVPYNQMRAGDIVAFNSPVSHVCICIGNGKFIHAPHTGDVVKITDLKYMNLTAIRRFTGVLANP